MLDQRYDKLSIKSSHEVQVRFLAKLFLMQWLFLVFLIFYLSFTSLFTWKMTLLFIVKND